MSKSLKTRPSELMGIVDTYRAYCFDEAVVTFGSFVSDKLSSVNGKNEASIRGQQELLLSKLLSQSAKAMFATPTATA
jgi:hypothetical protein